MINNNIFIFIILSLLFSLAIDVLYGEMPTIIHPVVIIGSIINFFKKIFIKIKNKSSGLLVVVSTTLTASVIVYIIYLLSSINNILLFIIYSLLLSSTFSVKMLLDSANDIKNDLNESIEKARKSVSYLVSRNTEELTESFIVSATIETLTENITDSYVAVIFYYMIFACFSIVYDINIYYLLMIAVFYRISNTLDAMLGYKTDELESIGFIPAKLDDVLNYIPSRISGCLIVIASAILKFNWKGAYKIMHRDARKCPSPNSGYTMAPTAGALNIQLVKKGTYVLGDDLKEITKDDISDAIKISSLTIILFTTLALMLFSLFWVII